jgi:hypothetical protein
LALASACIANAQIAILHVRVIEGEGAVHRAGSRIPRPLTVEVTDETGQPQAGVAVSFHLPENGPGGLCGNGLRTDLVMTDREGRASLPSLQLNRVAGPFHIRITVAKEQARAGLVSRQYVADPKGVSTGGTAAVEKPGQAPPVKLTQRRSHKWLVVVLVAAGAAAGGIAAGAAAGKSAASVPTAAASAPASVGAPSISIGKP